MYDYYSHGHWPMMWFWGIFVLIICIVGIVAIWKLSAGKQHRDKDSPLDILKRRYANGEISSEEYSERKKVLEGR